MSITAAELLAIGNERTGRSEAQADVDKFIKSWVHDLTTRGVFLEGEETVTLVDEQANYAESGFTNSYKKILAITILDTDSNESLPLDEISWRRYKERIAYSTDPQKPLEYCPFNSNIYLWYPPDADSYPYMKISGYIYHADSTTISYSERFRECGSQYVIFKIFEKYGYGETKGKTPFSLYETEVAKLLHDQANKKMNFVRYNDI